MPQPFDLCPNHTGHSRAKVGYVCVCLYWVGGGGSLFVLISCCPLAQCNCCPGTMSCCLSPGMLNGGCLPCLSLQQPPPFAFAAAELTLAPLTLRGLKD